jgi:Ca2+-binding EF-hand superfamily protein
MLSLLKQVDEDNSGDITLLELKRHIRKRRIIADKEGLSKLAERVVISGGTSFPTVYFEDFEKYTSIECASHVLKKIEDEEKNDPRVNLKTIFRTLDSDGGGTIDMEEFNQVLLELNVQLTPVEMADVFDIFDPDGGGEISYLELVYAVRHRKDFIRRLETAEKKRKKEEELNDQKHWDDKTKIKGRVEMNRADMEEHAILWMRKTSEHTTG